MKNLIVYVHGKGGSAQKAEHYAALFPNHEVIGFDYRSQTPWEAKDEFPAFFAERHHADLTVVPGGEHWFHTDEQMGFLDEWIRELSLKDVCV